MLRSILPILCVLLAAAAVSGEDPLTLTASADTSIQPGAAGDPGKYPGTAGDLMAYGPKHANKDYRALIQFDLKDVPKTPVAGAILKLSIFKAYSIRKTKQDILRVHRLVRPWGETSASWGRSVSDDEWINKGGDFDPTPIAATPLLDTQSGDASGKTIEFDITPLVQQWQSGNAPNFGIILINSDNESETTFRPFSREDGTDGNRPKLTLYWANPPKHDPLWLKASTLKPIGTLPQMKVVLNTSLVQARAGEAYKDTLKAKGGIAPYTFKVTGDIPGLTVAPDGAITGTPGKAGKYSVSVSITDGSKKSTSAKLDFTVVEPDKLAGKPEEKPKDADGKKPPEPAKPAEE